MATLRNVSIIIGFLELLLSRQINNILTVPKKKNLIKITNLFLLLSLLLLMCANRIGYDAQNFIAFFSYVRRYGENPWDYTYEAFFHIVRGYCSAFKTSTYYEFHAVVLVVVGIMIFIWNSRYIMNLTAVLFLYMASGTYAMDGMQIKNFIAVAMLVAAIPNLMLSDKKRYILGLILLLTASILHFSFVVYFIILIIRTPLFQRIKSIIPIVAGILYCVLFLFGKQLTYKLLLVLSMFPGMSKLQGYGNEFSGKRSLTIVLPYFTLLIVLYLGKNIHKYLSYSAKKYAETVIDIFLLLGITIPFSLYGNAVYRVYRNMYIPLFIVMSNCIVSLPRFHISRLVYELIVLVTVLLLFLRPYILHQATDLYLPILEGSYFWIE